MVDRGPFSSLALRSRRLVLLFATALGLAAAGSTVTVAAQRGAQHAYLAVEWPGWDLLGPGDCIDCSGSWWSWPNNDAPPSPPTAIVGPTRRWPYPA